MLSFFNDNQLWISDQKKLAYEHLKNGWWFQLPHQDQIDQIQILILS